MTDPDKNAAAEPAAAGGIPPDQIATEPTGWPLTVGKQVEIVYGPLGPGSVVTLLEADADQAIADRWAKELTLPPFDASAALPPPLTDAEADAAEQAAQDFYDNKMNPPPDPPPDVAPTLSAVDPNTAATGSAVLTVTATGTDFTASTVLQLDGADLATTYVDATSASAPIDPTTASVGTAQVTARNGSAVSNPVAFLFT